MNPLDSVRDIRIALDDRLQICAIIRISKIFGFIKGNPHFTRWYQKGLWAEF